MKTHIEFVLDKSGSMYSRIEDVIGGFNSFVRDQRSVPGELVFSLTVFDDKVKTIGENLEVPFLDRTNYVPGGNTALLDAVGTRIKALRDKSGCSQCSPEKVVFVIITDGEENASKTYKKSEIKEMVEHQRNKHDWQFVYLGADVDAFRDGTSLGFADHGTFSFNSSDYQKAYGVTGQAIAAYRSGIASSVNLSGGDGK